MATKAETVYREVQALIDSGFERRDAFKQLAEKYGQPLDSIRGSYYAAKKKIEGGTSPSRTRRRETSLDAALQDARASLERSLANIDREIEAAEERSEEAANEAEALKASAAARRKAISERLEALK